MASDFSIILEQLKKEVAALAQSTLKEYIKDAKKDAKSIIDTTHEKLERWTKLVEDGSLTANEFEWLTNSQKDLIQMEALKKAGLSKIKADQFKESVFILIVDTIFQALKII